MTDRIVDYSCVVAMRWVVTPGTGEKTLQQGFHIVPDPDVPSLQYIHWEPVPEEWESAE